MVAIRPLAVLALLAACPRAQEPAPAARVRPPNIVVILTDDQGYGDLSCQGHPTIATPHLDRLAARGTKLSQFYVASPVCSPSRAALLTGCYPKRVGLHEHVIFPGDDHGLHPDEVTIAELLREAGYATGCFGKWHLGHRQGMLPTDQGFDAFFGVPYSNDMSRVHRRDDDGYAFRLPLLRDTTVVEWEPDQRELTRRYTEAAIDFLAEHRAGPCFVYLAHSMPHIPLYVSAERAGLSPRGTYGDVIEEIDAQVGRLVTAIDELGLTRDTLLVFTSDNGPWLQFGARGGTPGPLRGGKGTNLEGGQRVPAIVCWPGRIPAGVVCREVVTAMDLLPTFAALAEVAVPTDRAIDGHDVRDLWFAKPGARSPTDVFLYYAARGPLAAVRRGPWKLMLDSGALHHVEHDIAEERDVAAKHPDLVAELAELARARDSAITVAARPVHRSEVLVFDPKR